MRFLSLLAASLASVATASSSSSISSSTQIPRFLEDYSGGYSSSSQLQFGKCVRIKVQEQNDDDGNSYFYNGAYRSQSIAYASYYLCDSCGDSCDRSTEYVTDLETLLENTVDFVQEHCNACSNACRRRLEDGGEEEDAQEDGYDGGGYDDAAANVDCNSCAKTCQNYASNGGTDETDYIYCQAAFEDNGVQLYSAPTCGNGGGLTMGLFYDDECTIKRSDETGFSESFSYNTFGTIQDMCVSCADTDLCGNVQGNSLYCIDGVNENENVEEDAQVCKKYKEVSKERIYAKRKRQLPLSMDLVFFALFLGACFTFLSYAYFVRHRNKTGKEEALVDHKDTSADQSALSYAELT